MRSIVMTTLFMLIPALAYSEIILVPQDYPTIQQAINAASNQDEILVSPGTYVEIIDFKGRKIKVRSTDGPDVTVIDGNFQDCVVTFKNQLVYTSVLDGFTITNGKGNLYDGAGIRIFTKCRARIINNKIIGNNGSGIYCRNESKVIISNNTISDNRGEPDGGGVYCDIDSIVEITGNVIKGNSATYFGGGIYCDLADDSTTIIGNLISENSVEMYGGGICNDGSDSIISGNTISNNYSAIFGGGIQCTGSSPLIMDNLITENYAGYDGGGINLGSSSSPIKNNVIMKNTAYASGGGIAIFPGSPIIFNNIIMENSAAFDGGGISCFGSSSPEIIDNTIALNLSNSHGGGIDCFTGDGTHIAIIGNAITENSVDKGMGGGICCDSPFATISNNIISGNSVSEFVGSDGGGIYFDGCKATLMNNTMVGNTAYGGKAIYCWAGVYLTITNSLIWNNGGLYPIYMHDICTIDFHYSDVEYGEDSVFIELSGTVNWHEGNLDTDPLFLDPSNGDYHLSWLSPCINRGTNEGAPSNDIDDDSRPCMGCVDIGADEFIGMHSLESEVFSISEATGGSAKFTLNGGLENSNRKYFIFGSITGTTPGTPLSGGVTLPLNWDIFTNLVYGFANFQSFLNFHGTFDTGGTSMAQFNTLGPLPSGSAGLTMHFAYLLYSPVDFASCPIAIEIVP